MHLRSLAHSHLDTPSVIAKPFLKWAGGKTQLLPELANRLPAMSKLDTYIEPFLGGGAFFFYLAENFPSLKHAYLIDANSTVISTYSAIRNNLESTLRLLEKMAQDFLKKDQIGRKAYFVTIRTKYNKLSHIVTDDAEQAAMFIFLNKTGFNGLYRVNSSGHFNVPMGQYKNPSIYNPQKLKAASQCLQRAELIHSDFSITKTIATPKSLVYYDPPYRPLTKTASFNAYHRDFFGDDQQRALADLFKDLTSIGVKQMLSNSDPKQVGDLFFDTLYKGFTIKRVKANRMINSNAAKRGQITEILVTNY